MCHKRLHRNNRQRPRPLQPLSAANWYPTAAQLCEFARQRVPKLRLNTVYRNFDLLAPEGAIQRLEISGTGSPLDGNHQRKCYVRCAGRGRQMITRLCARRCAERKGVGIKNARTLDETA